MFLLQGWKKQPDGSLQVAAIAISVCTNGMSGWQLHRACYAPDRGESLQTASWQFVAAAFSVQALLISWGLNEMLTWEDTQAAGDLKAALGRVEELLRRVIP